MNKWYHLTLSLATIAILSACSSSDDTPVPQIDKNDSVGICTGEQQSSTTNSVSVLVNCYDKDGIDLYGETADAPHILLSNGKKIYLSSIKEANILYENNEIIGVRDYQLIADLKDNSQMTAIAVMYSLNGNSLEYERVKSDNFILRTDKAEVPLEVVIPTIEVTIDTTAPVLSSTTQTFTSTVWTAITLENVIATDNVDGSVTVEQSWDTVDSNTAWTYEVVYTATDKAGNEISIIHTYIIEAPAVVNTAPTAIAGSIDWWFSSSKTFSMNAFIEDAEDDDSELEIIITKQPLGGTLSISWTNVTYTMASWNSWNDEFEFKVKDTKGLKSDVKKISLPNFDNV